MAFSSAESARSEGLRSDGRLPNQIRPVQVELGPLTSADGSVRYNQGHTSVLVAVYGPVSCKRRRDERIDRATISVLHKHISGQSSASDVYREEVLRTALEPLVVLERYPRSSIQLVVQVLRDDGSLLPCALNACCLALLDAGLELRGLLAGVAVVLKPRLNTGRPRSVGDADGQGAGDSEHMKLDGGSEAEDSLEILMDPCAEEFTSSSAAAATGADAAMQGSQAGVAAAAHAVERRLELFALLDVPGSNAQGGNGELAEPRMSALEARGLMSEAQLDAMVEAAGRAARGLLRFFRSHLAVAPVLGHATVGGGSKKQQQPKHPQQPLIDEDADREAEDQDDSMRDDVDDGDYDAGRDSDGGSAAGDDKVSFSDEEDSEDEVQAYRRNQKQQKNLSSRKQPSANTRGRR